MQACFIYLSNSMFLSWCFSSHPPLFVVPSSSSVLICLIISFSICLVWASNRKSSVSRWLRLVCQNSEALIRVSGSTQAASMQQYCTGLKVNVVFRGLSVFSPDGDISIVYRPLCACLSPNRDSGRSQNTESHRERLYHIQRSQHCADESVCVCAHELAATVQMF